jgi:hypothetical protein
MYVGMYIVPSMALLPLLVPGLPQEIPLFISVPNCLLHPRIPGTFSVPLWKTRSFVLLLLINSFIYLL